MTLINDLITVVKPLMPGAIRTSILVGTMLNVINQHAAILGPEIFNIPAAILTYFVPLSVSLYAQRQTSKKFALIIAQKDAEIAQLKGDLVNDLPVNSTQSNVVESVH